PKQAEQHDDGHEIEIGNPFERRAHDHDAEQPDHREDHHEHRDYHKQLGEAHDELVGEPTDVATDAAHADAENRSDKHGADADGERSRGAVEDAAQDVVAVAVGAH